jgi:hypothetical protein
MGTIRNRRSGTISVINRLFSVRLALLALVALAPFPAPAAAPVEPYGRLPSIEQAALSPDGAKIAFVQTAENWRVLAIFDLSQSKVIAALRAGSARTGSPEATANGAAKCNPICRTD